MPASARTRASRRSSVALGALLLGLLLGCGGQEPPPQVNPPSTNANLAALSVSVGALSPAFATGVTSYTATAAPSVSSATVTATKEAAGARLEVRANQG